MSLSYLNPNLDKNQILSFVYSLYKVSVNYYDGFLE